MKILHIVLLPCAALLIQACASTRSGNINKQDDCNVPGLDWMEGVEGYDKKEVFELATKFEAAARADADKVKLLKDANAEGSLTASLQQIINNTTGRKVKVSQEFFQKANAYRTTICSIERWLKEGTLSDPEQRIKAQQLLLDLSAGFNSIAANLLSRIEKLENKVQPRSLPSDKIDQLKIELSRIKGDTIMITCVWGDQEAFSFATELKNLFRSSGWIVDGVNQAAYNIPMKGIIITIKNDSAKDKANFIYQVLQVAGFDSYDELNEKEKFDISLIIGAK